ncbi:lipase family protein [Tomitella cavernea]|uniref:Alpha/beta fold hydrolase n=1 Tax=Tomitella cavernea TaxID=1387982 RepID=A0ABP9CYY0_9ACTN|nr:lipase family protein [Tomitella cavernea]
MRTRFPRTLPRVAAPLTRLGAATATVITTAAAAAALAAPALAAPAAGPETMLNDMLAGSRTDAPAQAAPDAFYDAPADLAGTRPGDVLRARPTAIDFAGLDLPVHATTVLYHSTDTHGDPIAVSGTVMAPDMPWTRPGPRPLVVLAPGTQGQGDQCAPSRRMPGGGSVDNLAQAGVFLMQGYAVAVTDYEGLGTPGIHTYMNRLSQAHTVLDMGRAAKNLHDPEIRVGAPVGLWGYSQGGGAVASAAEQVDAYAPDLGVRGAFAGAPPANLAVTTARVDGSRLAGAIGYAINGLEADYPQIVPSVDAQLNDRGRAMLRDVATQCTSATEDEFGGAQSTEFTVSGQPIESLLGSEPIKSVVAAQTIGTIRPGVPVFVVTGDGDDIVPARTVRTMVDRWCSLGGTVTFRDYPTPDIAPLVNHVAAMPIAAPEALTWMNDRLAGDPDAGDCAS